MNQVLLERRERQRRNQKQRPLGLMGAMLTGSIVTLIGVYSNVDPLSVLYRALFSSALMGVLISLGLMIIRTANSKT